MDIHKETNGFTRGAMAPKPLKVNILAPQVSTILSLALKNTHKDVQFYPQFQSLW